MTNKKSYLTIILLFISVILFAQEKPSSEFDEKVEEIETELINQRFDVAITKIDSLLMHHEDAYLYRLKGSAITNFNDRFIVDSIIFKKALKCYNKSIELVPDNFDGIHSRAYFYFTHQYYEEAGRDILRGIKLANNEEEMLLMLNLKGLVLTHTRKFEKAISIYEEIINRNTLDDKAYSNLAMIYLDLKKYDKSESLMKKSIEINFEEIRYRGNLGFIYLQSEQYQKAEEIFDELNRITYNREPVLLNNRGYARLKLGKLEEAQKDIEKSIEFYPDNSYAFRNLALLKIEIGNKIEACQHLKQAIQLKFTETYGGEVEQLLIKHCEN